MSLEVSGLDVAYGKVQVLFGVSFKVKQGTLTSIIGPNGAGKTTIVKTVSGLLRPAAGTMRFNGNDITRLPPHRVASRGITTTPEGRRLFPNLTVRENLLMGAYVSHARGQRAVTLEWVYSLFPVLKDRATQVARTLSGGEAQMLAIGRAVMSKPQMIMLDEPSQGLAPLVVDAVFKAIAGLKQTGISILLVEQHITDALELADYAYALENGRMVLEGSGREMLENPSIKAHYLGLV